MAKLNRAKLTTITVSYNNESDIGETIHSILELKLMCSDIFSILIDGDSSDSTLSIAKESSAFDIIVSEPDTGTYNAMNKGIKLVNSDWAIFTNAGDNILPENLAAIIDYIDYQSCDIISAGLICLSDQNKFTFHKSKSTLNPFSMWSLHPATIYKTDILKAYPFDESFRFSSDYDQLLKIKKNKHSISRIDINIAIFREGGASTLYYKKSCREVLRSCLKNNYSFFFSYLYFFWILYSRKS